jgi:hypothetical protein
VQLGNEEDVAFLLLILILCVFVDAGKITIRRETGVIRCDLV